MLKQVHISEIFESQYLPFNPVPVPLAILQKYGAKAPVGNRGYWSNGVLKWSEWFAGAIHRRYAVCPVCPEVMGSTL